MRRAPATTLSLAVAAALATLLVLAGPVAAVTGQQMTTLATGTYGMTCGPSGTDELCSRFGALPPSWQATITPATGTLTGLVTDSFTRSPGGDGTVAWMTGMHGTACGDKAAAGAYATQVAALKNPGDSVPTATVGNCTTSGKYFLNVQGAPVYEMASVVHPAPTPKPTKKPTPKPTPTPSPSPSPVPTLEPTAPPTPEPTASPGPTATPEPTATPNAGPVVLPPTPTPTAPSGPPPGGPPPTFTGAVLDITDVNLDGAALGGSGILALLLLLFMGFPAELFNDTVEQNYGVISGWFKKGLLGRIRRLGGRVTDWSARHRRAGIVGFVAIAALINSFVDPAFGLSLTSLAEFLGFFAGLWVVLVSFKLPPMLAHRRRTGDLGHLRPLPWALVIAALFVIVSRAGALEPGYLYGLVLGALFTSEVPVREEGRETLLGSIWTLAAALLGWLALSWVRTAGLPEGDLLGTFVETAGAAILVLGLEATAFGLMPLHFLPGFSVYKFSRVAWGILFFLSVFAFIHILIGPETGYLDHLTPSAFIAACGVFAVFGGLSIATWWYFRFYRRKPALEPALEGGPGTEA